MTQLIDTFARKFYYLRLSITDVCNFRCTYCLPNGYKSNGDQAFLSLQEITFLTKAFAELGTEKICLTGGEPTMRRDFIDIIATIKQNHAIKKIALTTNGYRLAKNVSQWKNAGLTDINVSVDSLDPRQFLAITGQDKFFQVMAGIDAALEAGYDKIKVNVVLMKNINDSNLASFINWIKLRPIQLRFIELMETGESDKIFRRHHVSGEKIQRRLLEQNWQQIPRCRSDGPAQVFKHPDYYGEIGLIMPYEQNFCQSCNRLRVSSIGHLHLCLFGERSIILRDLLVDASQSEALKARIRAELQLKRASHFLHQGDSGITSNLSIIGG
ncbi:MULTISPECIES: GTP 3',8-cyclase MoaA [unclassified Arsenophonus]|uniref:GTP 3',8-cyclase MoaA n=1 Tax=unclassified Arsenophonus TaxID=2627083 RepID=UPI00285CA72E|nr:GTP 3',8-cyclase MoaA [Arsenophonus sp.]MDR5610224.1 GTP 3',8-cyclase MoaA [Arsenophonus sp.]MDR5613999.1 GTP 3',8-cyclase MoaA [Arsenophonus sp.]